MPTRITNARTLTICLLLASIVTAAAGKAYDWRKHRTGKPKPKLPRVSLYNDLLDEPTVPDGQLSFKGGQVSNKSARELAPDEAAELINCDLTLLGNAVTRRGSVQLGGAVGLGGVNGLTYYDTQANQYLVASTLTVPYRFDGTNWVVLGAGFPSNAGRAVSFAQGIDRLYLADGFNNIWSWDGTSPADLGSAAPTEPPAAPKYIVWHTNRLCAAGMSAERDAIYFSQFLDGAVWDKAAWQIRVGAGEDARITGLLSWTNFNLVVFKNRSVWIVNTNPTVAVSDFEITPVHGRIGCPNGRTAAQVGSDVFFLSDSGVRSLRHTLATENQSEVGEALSAPVQDIINRINWPNIEKAAAVYWNNRYILSIPLDASATMYSLVYNTLTDSWSGTWTGWQARHFSYRQPSGDVPRLCFVKTNTSVWDWLDYQRRDQETSASYMDGGSQIATSILTRAQTFGERRRQKTGLTQQFIFEDSSTTEVVITALPSPSPETGFETINPYTNAYGAEATEMVRSFGLMHLGRFRHLQFRLVSGAGRLGLSSSEGAAFVESLQIEE